MRGIPSIHTETGQLPPAAAAALLLAHTAALSHGHGRSERSLPAETRAARLMDRTTGPSPYVAREAELMSTAPEFQLPPRSGPTGALERRRWWLPRDAPADSALGAGRACPGCGPWFTRL